ncbi:ABC transporter permease [Lacibacterium aquatile]|uniref:ABC transporter permease n=1 Tax=Lacibacterium aquatile TaxID=1168082 RepID=A0ABW5DQJ6_9PROT
MLKLLARRGADLLVTLFGVSVITFLLIRLVPGDAVQIMLGANAEVTPERLDALRQQLGIDRPIWEQYFTWLGGVMSGNFGSSLWTGKPVIEEIGARIGVTIELTLLSLGLAVLVAVPAGVGMAYLRNSASDYLVRILTVAGVTVPSFWLGSLLIYVMFLLFPKYPAVGYVPFSDDPWGNLQRMLLPVIALSLPVLAALARITRSAMLDALGQDYVRTARAKGLGEFTVVMSHAWRNALIPFVTTLGIMAGYLFGGAIVVEQVFALPGLGRLMLGAINERNYPLIQAAILFVTSAFVVINFLIDLLYVAIDPRVSLK